MLWGNRGGHMLFDPSTLHGRYVVPLTGIASVFGGRYSPLRRCKFRRWPFLVTSIDNGYLYAGNITTNHQLELKLCEITAIAGDLTGPARHFAPVVLTLRSQICWDALDIWSEPLENFWSRPRLAA
jgi:hypothetical protein